MCNYESGQRIRVLPCGAASAIPSVPPPVAAPAVPSAIAAAATAAVAEEVAIAIEAAQVAVSVPPPGTTFSPLSSSRSEAEVGPTSSSSTASAIGVTAVFAAASAASATSPAARDPAASTAGAGTRGGSTHVSQQQSGGRSSSSSTRGEKGSDMEAAALHAEHHFHARCIDMWLREHASCPICRQSMLDPSVLAVQRAREAEIQRDRERYQREHERQIRALHLAAAVPPPVTGGASSNAESLYDTSSGSRSSSAPASLLSTPLDRSGAAAHGAHNFNISSGAPTHTSAPRPSSLQVQLANTRLSRPPLQGSGVPAVSFVDLDYDYRNAHEFHPQPAATAPAQRSTVSAGASSTYADASSTYEGADEAGGGGDTTLQPPRYTYDVTAGDAALAEAVLSNRSSSRTFIRQTSNSRVIGASTTTAVASQTAAVTGDPAASPTTAAAPGRSLLPVTVRRYGPHSAAASNGDDEFRRSNLKAPPRPRSQVEGGTTATLMAPPRPRLPRHTVAYELYQRSLTAFALRQSSTSEAFAQQHSSPSAVAAQEQSSSTSEVVAAQDQPRAVSSTLVEVLPPPVPSAHPGSTSVTTAGADTSAAQP